MWEIRTITDDDADLFRSRLRRGFGQDGEDDEAARERFEAIFEYERTFAVFDDDDIIGTGAAFSLGITVPGGVEVPMAGTTVIAVQPTHRRRGVLRAFMDKHFDEVEERGEPLAGLWASESSIYGRFGYGPATYRHIMEVDTTALDLTREPTDALVRFAGDDEVAEVLPALYEKARGRRPGMLSRSQAWWTHRIFADPETWREGKSKHRYVVVEEGGALTGYATYRQKSKWENFISAGEVDVEEIITLTPDADAALWSFLMNIDLFPKLGWWNLPLDDALPYEVGDQRRVSRRLSDALYVRVMDVIRALEARTYEADGAVTIAVSDPTGRQAAGGTFRVEVVDGTCTCSRVDAAAEVTFDADVMGHLYLGGGNALAMAAAGRVQGDPGAIRALHRIFRTDSAPWCPEVF